MKFFNHKPEIEGFDTESNHGNILLLASSDNFVEPKCFNDIIDFLWYQGKELNFFYNLGFDWSVILKPFLQTQVKFDLEEIRRLKSFEVNGYKISWVGNKAFSIVLTKSKRRKDYFDIAQFYNDGSFQTLDTVAKEVLGYGKNNEELGIDREKIGNEEGYYLEHRDLIIKYCKQDAKITKELSEYKVNSVYKDFNFYPKSWYSNASISKAYLSKFHSDEKWLFWKLINNDKRAFNYIFNSYNGGLFNTFKLGYQENISELDINSAYPSALVNLYSIKNAIMKEVNAPSDTCDYGFYHVKMRLNGLIPYRTNNHLIYPISIVPVEIFMTKIEYDYWKSKGLECEFLDGFEIWTDKQKPFQDYIKIYEERKKIKHNKDLESKMKSYNIKTILNASYGCFAESHNGFTYWSNFIYASYITARTRITIYNMVEQVGRENLIAIMTDAVVFKDTGQKIEVSDDLGKFKYEDEFKDVSGIFYMNGLYVINKHLKKRGFPSLKIEDLKGKNEVQIKRLKIRKVLEAIVQSKIEEIGDFKYEDKSIKLVSNLNKMEFNNDLLTFDYLNSHEVIGEPIIVGDCSQSKNFDNEFLIKIIKREFKVRKFIKN